MENSNFRDFNTNTLVKQFRNVSAVQHQPKKCRNLANKFIHKTNPVVKKQILPELSLLRIKEILAEEIFTATIFTSALKRTTDVRSHSSYS